MIKRLKSTKLIYLAIAAIVILMLIFGKRGEEEIETLEKGLGIGNEEDAGSGFLEVETFPSDADIYVDGILKGKSPDTLYGITAGTHNIVIKKEGYEDYVKDVSIEAGKKAFIEADLVEEVPKGPSLEIEYYISGWFTREASDENVKDFRETAKTFQADVAIMESFPMKFQIYPLDRENCPEVREILGTLQYIQGFDECRSRPTQPGPEAETEDVWPTRPETEPIETIEEEKIKDLESKNTINIGTELQFYYDFSDGKFTDYSSTDSDVFSRRFDTYLIFTRFSPVNIKTINKNIESVNKEDCISIKGTFEYLYSGRSLCIITKEGQIAAIGGYWENTENAELSWKVFD